MSLQAKRFRFEALRETERHKKHHHVPPRSRGGTHTIRVETVQHRAYHILFGAAGSLDECVMILRRDWWPDREDEV